MKASISLLVLFVALAFIRAEAAPLGTAFTYQGRLTDGNGPVNGFYDVELRLFTDAVGTTQVGNNVNKTAVLVSNGLFTTLLDFGPAAFTGQARWIGMAVRTNGSGTFALLAPRQELTPAPYALYAPMAGSVSNSSVGVPHLRTLGPPLAGQVLAYDGTSLVWQPPGGGTGVWALNGNSAYYNGGNVGIGTPNPQRRFQIGDDQVPNSEGLIRLASRSGAGPASRIWEVGVPENDENTDFGYHFVIDDTQRNGFNPEFIIRWDTGNVGIGSINPQGRLEIVGQDALRLVGYQPFMGFFDDNAGYAKARIQSANGNFFLKPDGGHVTAEATDLWLGHSSRRGSPGRALVDGGGALHVNFDTDWADTVIGGNHVRLSASDFWLGHVSRRGSPGRAIVDGGSELHVNFANDWAKTVIGGGNVSVCTLTIRGGCDLAEPFQMSSTNIPKGSVVIIDEKNPGHLKLSEHAYDTRVAGIVSGANGVNVGITMHQQGLVEGNENIALSGRVYVRADTTFGTIQPGDLLTTSDTLGHAMKAVDHARAQGAILGKAMSALTERQGMVLVLVTLQ